jgi:four helix bundle protein
MGVAYARHFNELEVYKVSRELAREIFALSKSFPKSEAYSLTDQMRRSSESVGAQIAEAWGKRRYEKHFISKLTDADSEQLETQHWIDLAYDCQYLTMECKEQLMIKSESIGKMINGMISKSHLFCDKEKISLTTDH